VPRKPACSRTNLPPVDLVSYHSVDHLPSINRPMPSTIPLLHGRNRVLDQPFKHFLVEVIEAFEVQARLADLVLAELREQRPIARLAIEINDELPATDREAGQRCL